MIELFSTFSYHPPKGTDAERVEVREMINPNHPMKNKILSMSDLHLDCEWSKNMYDRLNSFITKLASVAEVRTDQRKLMVFVWGGKPQNQKNFHNKNNSKTPYPTHLRSLVLDPNQGHTTGRLALSPSRHPCLLNTLNIEIT